MGDREITDKFLIVRSLVRVAANIGAGEGGEGPSLGPSRLFVPPSFFFFFIFFYFI